MRDKRSGKKEGFFSGVLDDETVSLPRVRLARQNIDLRAAEESLHWAEIELQWGFFYVHISLSHLDPPHKKKKQFSNSAACFFVFFLSTYLAL